MSYADPLIKNQTHPFARAQLQQRWRLFAIATVAVLLIFGAVYWLATGNKGGIIIEINNPKNLTIILNNRIVQPEQRSGGLYLPVYAGQYRLQISKPDYIPFTQDIVLSKGQTVTLRPAFALLPKQNQTVSSTTVDFVRPSQDQNALFYLGDNRQSIYRLDIASRVPVVLINHKLSGVTDMQWSGEPDVALISQSSGVYLQEIPSFDFQHQTSVKIGGSEVISPIWDPNNPGRMAFAYYPSSGERSLIFTDKTRAQLDRKADLTGINNPKLVWSADDSTILILDRGSDRSKNNIWTYTTADGTLKQLTSKGGIADAAFSSDSTAIIYENSPTDPNSSLTSHLTLLRLDGSNSQNLNIAGHVAQVAWKDSQSFFIPDYDNNSLTLYHLNGSKENLAFSFPDPTQVHGMFYYPVSKTLIFYTGTAIYTVNLGE